MSAPAQTPATPEAVEQQKQSVTRCLLAILRAFDTPCGCGHLSSECTMRPDGTCDG